MTRHRTGILAILISLVGLAPAPLPAYASRPLTVGTISHEPARAIGQFLPLARYLAKQLSADGYDDGKVVVAEGVAQMATLLGEGKVDLYLDGPFSAFAVSDIVGGKLALRWWRGGAAEQASVLFARKDSGLTRLEDLGGKTIAFEDATSSFGYLLPKMFFEMKGAVLKPKNQWADKVRPNEVGYLFTHDDESTLEWVARGKVPAGAMGKASFTRLARGGSDFVVVHETLAFPSGFVCLRANVSPALEAKLIDALSKLDKQEEGRALLHNLDGTTKFDPVAPEGLTPLTNARPFIRAEYGLP